MYFGLVPITILGSDGPLFAEYYQVRMALIFCLLPMQMAPCLLNITKYRWPLFSVYYQVRMAPIFCLLPSADGPLFAEYYQVWMAPCLLNITKCGWPLFADY